MYMTEKINLRSFDQLNKDEKVEAILSAVMEPVSKELALDFAGIEYSSLSESDREKIDAIFNKYQSQADDKYIVDDNRRTELSMSLNLQSVHAKIANNIWANLGL